VPGGRWTLNGRRTRQHSTREAPCAECRGPSRAYGRSTADAGQARPSVSGLDRRSSGRAEREPASVRGYGRRNKEPRPARVPGRGPDDEHARTASRPGEDTVDLTSVERPLVTQRADERLDGAPALEQELVGLAPQLPRLGRRYDRYGPGGRLANPWLCRARPRGGCIHRRNHRARPGLAPRSRTRRGTSSHPRPHRRERHGSWREAGCRLGRAWTDHGVPLRHLRLGL
jgi:hypothetical protein